MIVVALIDRLQRGRAQLSAEGSTAGLEPGQTSFASTGPRSIERGRLVCFHLIQRPLAELQRGRAQLSAEGLQGWGRREQPDMLQRGRAQLSAEGRSSSAPPCTV